VSYYKLAHQISHPSLLNTLLKQKAKKVTSLEKKLAQPKYLCVNLKYWLLSNWRIDNHSDWPLEGKSVAIYLERNNFPHWAGRNVLGELGGI